MLLALAPFTFLLLTSKLDYKPKGWAIITPLTFLNTCTESSCRTKCSLNWLDYWSYLSNMPFDWISKEGVM